ncbi:hypothetical protein HPB49_026397 [Dermacentor silvarum]|nr:hypothetical protein HPB49_026397 [Dermacentor silvarum]
MAGGLDRPGFGDIRGDWRRVLRRGKHVLPHLGRFCLVSTFLEDGCRMWYQWGDQRDYMNHSWGCGWFLASLFVLVNLVGQLGGSIAVLARFHVVPSCGLLFFIVVLQIATENQWFSGSESRPQPPLHQSHASRSSSSTSASSAIHSEPGSKAYKTADEAASSAAAQAEACGDDAGNLQYCDPWDTDPATVALRLLRAEEQHNKSPTPAHATPAAGRASSADAIARQRHIYETALDLRVEQRVSDQGLDQMAQSPVQLLPGLQQQPRAGPLRPVPSSSLSSEVSVIPGRKGGITRQPLLQDACYPKPRPHQGSSCSIF